MRNNGKRRLVLPMALALLLTACALPSKPPLVEPPRLPPPAPELMEPPPPAKWSETVRELLSKWQQMLTD